MPERRIGGNDSSSWATPGAWDDRGPNPKLDDSISRHAANGTHKQVGLRDSAVHWPTPSAHDAGSNNEKSTQNANLARDASMWPTPSAANPNETEDPQLWLARAESIKAKGINGNGAGMPGSRYGTTLLDAVNGRWATPTAMMSGYTKDPAKLAARTSGDNRRGHEGCEIARQAEQWSTPTSRDWKDGADPSENAPTNGLLGRQAPRWASLPDPQMPTDGDDGSTQAAPLRLCPEFVEALMGFPTGWTRLAPIDSDASGTLS
jgi:hypothetical protein